MWCTKGYGAMTRSLVLDVTIALLLCRLTGCWKPPPVQSLYGMPVNEANPGGIGTLGLSVAGQPVKGLVIYFHGSDQNARVIADDRKHTDLFDPLLRAGYAIVSADADGNAFGNPA